MSLELDHATMQRLGRQVADHVARHLAGLREQRVVKTLSRREAEPLIYTPPPREGADFDALMAFLETRVFPHHTPEPHPGCNFRVKLADGIGAHLSPIGRRGGLVEHNQR